MDFEEIDDKDSPYMKLSHKSLLKACLVPGIIGDF